MPFYPITDNERGHPYNIETIEEKLIADYARISFFELAELDLFDYLQLRRDAFLSKMSRTNEGCEYLQNAWRLEQTEPDREKLREKFGRTERRSEHGR